MREFLESVLGSYTPVTYDTIIDGELYEIIPAGLAGVDWSFVLTGALFCIVIFSVLRILGGVICKIS